MVLFPDSSVGKESACNAGGPGSFPGLGRSPGEGKGYPLQCQPGEVHGMDSPWGHRESDTTEGLSRHFSLCVRIQEVPFEILTQKIMIGPFSLLWI